MPMPATHHDAPSLVGLTPEVLTVSALLSMPAVWTAFIERELPFGVLLERFLIVLLTCALLAELVRRLGEGGALGTIALDAAPTSTDAKTTAAQMHFEDDDLGFGGFGGFEDFGASAPLALDAPTLDGTGLDTDPLDANIDANIDAALDAPLADFGSIDDLGELAPLDLNADPFSDPV
jgi:hypothetical protein